LRPSLGNGRQGELPVPRAADKAPGSDGTAHEERSVGELFRQLSDDTAALVGQEIALVKAELRQTGTTLAHDAAKVGTALGLAFLGAIALTAFLVAGLGDVMDGKYWLSALIVGVIYVAVGSMLAKNAFAGIKRRGDRAKQAVETVKNTASWAKQEVSDAKQQLTS
jgi:hypothetical protein